MPYRSFFFSAVILTLGLVFTPRPATAVVTLEPSFPAIADENIRVLTRGECKTPGTPSDGATWVPRIPNGIRDTRVVSWAPNAAPYRLELEGCRPRDLEKIILTPTGHTREQAKAIGEFFIRCDESLRSSAPRGVVALTDLLRIDYNVCENPRVRKISLRLENGDHVRGFLALKPDVRPRPMVVVKCGAFCSAGDASTLFMLMHLFDESPFNVLALGNMTGSDFVIDNKHVAMGGFLEGQQMILVAKLLRGSSLASRISSLHAVGLSLAGHAALYAS